MVFRDGSYRVIGGEFRKALVVRRRNMGRVSEKVVSEGGAKVNRFQGKNFELKRI